MAHGGQLWEMALEHFGSKELLRVAVDMWDDVAPPPRPWGSSLTTTRQQEFSVPLSRTAVVYRALRSRPCGLPSSRLMALLAGALRLLNKYAPIEPETQRSRISVTY